MPLLKLKSSDNEFFVTDMQTVKCCGTIKSILTDFELEDSENLIIPLSKVNSASLRKILEWINYHKDDPQPQESDESAEERTDDISSWDAAYLKELDNENLSKLIGAAKYLKLKGLLDLTDKTINNMTKGKTPEEKEKIMQIFEIEEED